MCTSECNNADRQRLWRVLTISVPVCLSPIPVCFSLLYSLAVIQTTRTNTLPTHVKTCCHTATIQARLVRLRLTSDLTAANQGNTEALSLSPAVVHPSRLSEEGAAAVVKVLSWNEPRSMSVRSNPLERQTGFGVMVATGISVRL